MPGKPRVVVAAGGTAGHVVPAMAVADELRASGAEVTFLGTRERIEAELVPAAGYEIDFVKVRGIDRRNPLRAARGRASRRWARSAPRARVLRRRGADVVMGGGGFVAGPAGLAALLTADAAGPDRGRQPPRPRQPPAGRAGAAGLPRLPDRGPRGRPLPGHRAAGAGGGARRPTAARPARASGSPPRRRCLLVVGGSQGARSINFAAVEAFAERDGRDFHVLHLAGSRDYRGAASSGSPRRPHARALHAARLRAGPRRRASPPADLVLGRSGGSIFEVTAAGRPAILVPYPHATADHQSANAAWMERAGAATVIADAELSAGAACAAEVGAAARRPGAAGGDGRRRARRWPSPTRPAASPTRSWAAAPMSERRDWAAAGCTSSASAAPG